MKNEIIYIYNNMYYSKIDIYIYMKDIKYLIKIKNNALQKNYNKLSLIFNIINKFVLVSNIIICSCLTIYCFFR